MHACKHKLEDMNLGFNCGFKTSFYLEANNDSHESARLLASVLLS